MHSESGTTGTPSSPHNCWPPHRILYPVEEAAVLMGISDRQLWTLINDGEVQRKWNRGRCGVHIKEINRFLDALPTEKPDLKAEKPDLKVVAA